MCPPCCWTTLKLATPLTNGVINETLRQFAPLSDISQGSVAIYLRCGDIFSDSIVHCKFSPDSDNKIISKIDYYLIKLRHRKYCANFWGSECLMNTE